METPATSGLGVGHQQFWNCISILLRNYHAVNKKIFSCVLGEVRSVSHGIGELHGANMEEEILGSAQVVSSVCTSDDLEACLSNVDDAHCEGFVVKFKFLTKKLAHNIRAVGVIDIPGRVYSCKFLNCDIFDDFSVKYSSSDIFVEILSQRLDAETSKRWATFVLKPKLEKWCLSAADIRSTRKQGPSTQSLRWVDVEEYNDLYKELKRKHSAQVLQYWNDAKESTDPLKFIYEDLAIAAYLITLWRSAMAAPPPTSFADLGCGNGLLVYILNAEGYHGYGFDIRARKLWSCYPAATASNLIEQAIEPDRTDGFPADVDWLIGNHSDELSPWLPVLAATASYRMRYFLLPCCAFELSGAKFQRRNSAASVYQDFYAYAATLSEKSGFRTLQDRLKIPSTKRLALLGIERTYESDVYEAQRREIKEFVAEERRNHACILTSAAELASGGVKLREKQELVRNCTQIDANVIAALVQQIFGLLLAAAAAAGENDNATEKEPAPTWQHGGTLSMREIATRLSSDDLKRIKAECGGIKTLLRNKHEIFEFRGNDQIGIRKPQVRKVASSNQHHKQRPQTMKKRLCFFKQHHPQGCPLTAEQCTFLH